MRLLLDTHTLIWVLGFARTLPQSARTLIGDHRNVVHVSAVSIHEIAAKRAAARRRMPNLAADEAIELSERAGYRLLDITPQHAAAVEGIAVFHGDPFDRLLLAQAKVEGLQLLTHDERLAAYDSRTILF